MKLATYNTEIEAIMDKHTPAGGDRHMSVDMFLANIKNAGDPKAQYDYTVGTGFDYMSLKPYLKELEEDKPNYYTTR